MIIDKAKMWQGCSTDDELLLNLCSTFGMLIMLLIYEKKKKVFFMCVSRLIFLLLVSTFIQVHITKSVNENYLKMFRHLILPPSTKFWPTALANQEVQKLKVLQCQTLRECPSFIFCLRFWRELQPQNLELVVEVMSVTS